MNVKELHTLLTTALARGINPDTTVVFDDDGNWMIVSKAYDPTDPEYWDGDDPIDAQPSYIWFTLETDGTFADPRFTPGHYPHEHYDNDPTPPHGIARPVKYPTGRTCGDCGATEYYEPDNRLIRNDDGSVHFGVMQVIDHKDDCSELESDAEFMN